MADNIYFRTSINGFNKADVLQYIKGLIDKNAELASEIEALKKELDEQKQLAEENAQNAPEVLPDENDIEKLSEQKLGRVMYDARRFSDLIVKEATDRADFIFANATDSSDNLAEQVNALKKEAESFSSDFSSALAEITKKLSSLGNSLSDFRNEVEEQKKNFEEKIKNND
ncbi:MAG: DivIVA domain-containing protein [Oscillospiraceae bacterium]|nr:DivIVA domain-containing protein [Oscillospiraceae bacterium]